MNDTELEKIHQWLESHEAELIADTRSMLQIPSLESEATPGAPFGPENRRALDFALELGHKYGFNTCNLDGYIGYADFGTGPKQVLSLGHLDVVPTGPGWTFPEFGAEIHEGYIYARGAVDDKGPTMASFYAMRAIKEACSDLGVQFRQAFGCNEESGFKCVDHYVENENPPTFGVAPDSGWPCCYAEKGIGDLIISVPRMKTPLEVVSVAGGQRPNIVIDHVEAVLEVGPEVIDFLQNKSKTYWDKNVEFHWNGSSLRIVSHGKAAHGSTPFLGDSALTRVFRALIGICPPAEAEYFEKLLEFCHPSGSGIGIHGREDATGDLTSNPGIIETIGDDLVFTVNVRCPTSWSAEDLEGKAHEYLSSLGIGAKVKLDHLNKGLYFAKDSDLVSTIVDCYRAETGDLSEPFTMGGGTYARAVANSVSIGTGWLGDGDAHQTDERIKVDHLLKMSKIYARIFFNLALKCNGK